MKVTVLAIILAALSAGCVTKKQARVMFDDGYRLGTVTCAVEVERLNAELEIKNARLRSFNQINSDGTLRGQH